MNIYLQIAFGFIGISFTAFITAEMGKILSWGWQPTKESATYLCLVAIFFLLYGLNQPRR